MSAWKNLERRVCRALGAERAGPRGRHGADDDGSAPYSIECKRTTRYQLRQAWILQARRQSKQDGRPWLLVVAEHGDRNPIAVQEFATVVTHYQLLEDVRREVDVIRGWWNHGGAEDDGEVHWALLRLDELLAPHANITVREAG